MFLESLDFKLRPLPQGVFLLDIPITCLKVGSVVVAQLHSFVERLAAWQSVLFAPAKFWKVFVDLTMSQPDQIEMGRTPDRRYRVIFVRG